MSGRAPRLPWRLLPCDARGALRAARLLPAAMALLIAGGAASEITGAEITGARYDAPTTRYAHAVLGDGVEYGGLVLSTSQGERRFDLPSELVFEDVAPRVWDVTGDGTPEVVVVESHAARGARLAVYTAEGRLAATPYIGTRFRWLAPVGAADLDGDGQIEIAYVDRPHLAKTLRLWRLTAGEWTEIGAWRGVTNHRIGEDFISGGVRSCAGLPELVVADADWRSVMVLSWEADDLRARRLPIVPDADGFARALACEG